MPGKRALCRHEHQFNPGTFSVMLNSLVPNTNYFFRFYAANRAHRVGASFRAIQHRDSHRPDYGSQMKLTFSGYNRGEVLQDFPVLVNLSTNSAGLFLSAICLGDRRRPAVQDAGGLLPIPFEIDEWNTNGISICLGQCAVAFGTNDFIWAYWGNPLATNVPASSTNGGVAKLQFGLALEGRRLSLCRQHAAISGA